MAAYEVPCALQYYIDRNQKRRTLSKLEAITAFKHWVAYIRVDPESVSPKEQTMCPLLWCRASFQDPISTLLHVAQCSRIEDAEYWCPHCSRPERFLDRPKSQNGINTTPQRRDSKLKKAVTFFKHLRHRPCAPAPSSYTISNSDGYGPSRESMVEETWPDYSVPAELSNHSSQARRPRHEMPAKDINASTQAVAIATEKEKIGSQHLEQEPPAYQRVAAVERVERYSDPLKDIGSQFNNVDINRYCRVRETQMVSPISPDGMNMLGLKTTSSPVPSGSSDYSLTPYISIPELGGDSVVPCSVSSGATERSPRSENSAGPQSEKHDKDTTLSTLVKAKDLQDAVMSLHQEWLRRLSNCSELRDQCSKLELAHPFHKGIQTLQAYLRGTLPQNFQDIYALMIIAGACAYWVHKDNDQYSWNGLFDDMVRWQSAAVDDSERECLDAMTRKVTCMPPPVKPVRRSQSSMPPDHAWAQESKLDSSVAHNHNEVMTGLRNGQVMNACLEFLDDFRYLSVVERNAKSSPSTHSWYAQQHPSKMESMITQRLQQLDGIEALHEPIWAIGRQIRQGLMHSIRDVEVTLLQERSYRSPSIHQRYTTAVANLCDDAMQGANTNWRHDSYILDLDTIMINIDESPASRYSNSVDYDTMDYAVSSSSTSAYSTFLTKESMSPGRRYPFSADDIGTSPSNTATATISELPSNTSNASTSPRPLASAVSGVSSCSLCKQTFEGLSRTTNLQRHMLTIHHRDKSIPCRDSGCKSTFTRVDNLMKHLRTVHKAAIPLRRQGARKRRRGSE